MKQTSAKRNTLLHPNPVMNRVTAVNETAEKDAAASYTGITIKTGYFLLMTVVGMVIYLFAQTKWFQHQEQISGLKYDGFAFSLSVPQAITIVGASIVAIIFQLIAAFAPKTIPVSGTLYSMAQGVIISGIIFTVLGGENHMEYLGLLALVITIVVVFTMALLYTKGIIKVNNKFRMVLMTLLLSTLGISLITLICSFIPGVNTFVSRILGNFWVSIILTLLSIVISTLFLVSEFDVMDQAVQQKMPVKYEWYVAFGLSFAILWIYIKILELIIRIAGRGQDK